MSFCSIGFRLRVAACIKTGLKGRFFVILELIKTPVEAPLEQ
jgi:hypothetical protein